MIEPAQKRAIKDGAGNTLFELVRRKEFLEDEDAGKLEPVLWVLETLVPNGKRVLGEMPY